ncbi:epg-4 [Pristionchus pacificus]|nr:epg-4 [Pristionchus pacificus]
MDLATIRSVALDFLSGAASVPRGPVELFQLEAANEVVPPTPPSKPIPTVLQLRREKDGRYQPRKEEPPPPKKASPLKRVGMCMFVNIGFACFMTMILNPFFIYITSFLPEWMKLPPYISQFLPSFTMMPFFIITRLMNVFVFADIASACYRKANRPTSIPMPSISISAADFIASILLEVVFMVQTALMKHLPLPGVAFIAVFVHMSMLNSMYSFEYFWMSNGVPLIRRIDRLERRWPFFLGFGAPLTALTLYSDNTLVQGCIFGALFPLFIIASYSADWTSIRHINGYIPVFRIFYPSLLFTTKLSVYISEKLIGRSIRRSPQ